MEITVAEKIKLIMGRKNMTATQLAAATNQTRQNLHNKMVRDNFSTKDIMAMAEALGCEVVIEFHFPDGSKV